MTALFTALLESETKESLVVMVCELREKLAAANRGWLDQAAREAADEITRLEQKIEQLEADIEELRGERYA